MLISKEIAKTCTEAFEIGLYAEMEMTQIELMKKINWIRGRYKKMFWEAYKCGVWTREQKAVEHSLHPTPESGRVLPAEVVKSENALPAESG